MPRNQGLEERIGLLLVEGGFLSQEQMSDALMTCPR